LTASGDEESCHAPRKRGIQYAVTVVEAEVAAFTGSSAFADDDNRGRWTRAGPSFTTIYREPPLQFLQRII
jgi:hypothetical protein